MGLYWLFSRHFELDGQACLDDPLTDVEAVQELMRAYRKMSVAEQVRAVQRLLMEKGYDVGPINGVLGEPTRRAIRQFQARRGDPPTGQISAPLYLQLSMQRKPGGPPVGFSTMQYQTQRIQTGRGHALP
jgi:peptidoglycan hydrolase-like protein with peptidoglycan-binding domain